MNGKAWAIEHTDTLRRMAAVGYTDAEIGSQTGHCAETVRRQRTAMGLPSCKRIDWQLRSGRDKVRRITRKQPCAIFQSL